MSAITIGGDLIHYEKLGRGRPVILVHGWIGSWRYWIPLMQKLHTSFSVYTLDLVGFGDSYWFKEWFDGRVQALWFLLGGIALYKIAEGYDTAFIQKTTLKEGGILIGMGLIASLVWQAELLLPLGFCMIFAIPFLRIPRWALWPSAFVMTLAMPLFALVLNLDAEWDIQEHQYLAFWAPFFLIKRIFINGHFPVFSYMPFVLIGIWLGGKNIHNQGFRSTVMWLSLTVMILTFFGAAVLGEFAYMFSGTGIHGMELYYAFRIEKIFPMPVFIVNTTAWCLFIMMTLATWLPLLPQSAQRLLSVAGYLSPWIYLVHVLLGIGLMKIIGWENSMTGDHATIAAVIFLLVTGGILYFFHQKGSDTESPLTKNE